MDKHYKVSFCITCKGRLEHLKQTLPLNLKNNEDYPNTEFVILNYDSPDGLEEWVKENFQAEIASGKIRYARYTPAEHFRMSHAKNMAHRLATGDILCNLDADNVTGKNYAGWLNETFSRHPDSYISPMNHAMQRLLKPIRGEPSSPGLNGRIAIMKRNFYKINGYDEIRFDGYARQDTNMAMQAAHLHCLKHVLIPEEMQGSVIEHSDKKRIELMGEEHKADFLNNKALGRHEVMGLPMGRIQKFIDCLKFLPEYRHRANYKAGLGEVAEGAGLYDINGQKISLSPLPSRDSGASLAR